MLMELKKTCCKEKKNGEDDDIDCGEMWCVSGVAAGTILAGLVVRPNKGAQHWFQR